MDFYGNYLFHLILLKYLLGPHSYVAHVDLLILLINKNKRKSTRKLINKIKNRHEQHRNEAQGDILKVSEAINNFHRNPILPIYHPVNRYNQIEYDIKNQINEINRKLHDNGSKLLENKREPSINWTAHNNDSFEILRKAVKDKDPEAGKIIVEQVPEFKNMMEEVAAIGASGAKKYINHLHYHNHLIVFPLFLYLPITHNFVVLDLQYLPLTKLFYFVFLVYGYIYYLLPDYISL